MDLLFYYKEAIIVEECSLLTRDTQVGRLLDVTFKKHKDIVEIDIEVVVFHLSHQTTCSKKMYIPDFGGIVAGHEDEMLITIQAGLIADSDGVAEVFDLATSRLVVVPDECGPKFDATRQPLAQDVPIECTERDSDVINATDGLCDLDCTMQSWVHPSPVTLWYLVKVGTEDVVLLDENNGIPKLRLNTLPLNFQIGDKIACIVSNELKSIKRVFTLQKQPGHHFEINSSRIVVFFVDMAIFISMIIFFGIMILLIRFGHKRCKGLKSLVPTNRNHQPLTDEETQASLHCDLDEAENEHHSL